MSDCDFQPLTQDLIARAFACVRYVDFIMRDEANTAAEYELLKRLAEEWRGQHRPVMPVPTPDELRNAIEDGIAQHIRETMERGGWSEEAILDAIWAIRRLPPVLECAAGGEETEEGER